MLSDVSVRGQHGLPLYCRWVAFFLLCERKKSPEPPYDMVASSKWVESQFWVDYPFKNEIFLD